MKYQYSIYKVVCVCVCVCLFVITSPPILLDRSEPNFAYHISVGPAL